MLPTVKDLIKFLNSQTKPDDQIEFDEHGWMNVIRNYNIYVSIDEEDLMEESEEE